MLAIAIYKNNPTLGAQDGDILSNGIFSSYLSFEFDISTISETEYIVPLAIRTAPGLRTSTATVISSDNSYLQFCLTKDGVFTNNLTIEDSITDTNTIFYLKVTADATESLGTDRNTLIHVATKVGNGDAGIEINNQLAIYSPFTEDLSNLTGSISWINQKGSPVIEEGKLKLDGSSYIQSEQLTLGGKSFTVAFDAYIDPACAQGARLVTLWAVSATYNLTPTNYQYSLFELLTTTGGTSILRLLSNGKANCESAYRWVKSDTTLSPYGEKHHFAVVYDYEAATLTLFVDGKRTVRRTNCPKYERRKYAINIGALDCYGESNPYYYTGTISNFCFYDGIALWHDNFEVPGSNTFYFNVSPDLERIITDKTSVWRYDNYGTAELLSSQRNYTTGKDVHARYNSVFWGGYSDVPCFDVPDSPEVWIKFDIFDTSIVTWHMGALNNSGNTMLYMRNGTSSIRIQNGTNINDVVKLIPDPNIGRQRRLVLHIKTGQENGFVEVIENDKVLCYLTGNINDGNNLSNLYCCSGASNSRFSNIVISNAKIGTSENAIYPSEDSTDTSSSEEISKEISQDSGDGSDDNTSESTDNPGNHNDNGRNNPMANLIKQHQVQGLVALQALVNQINTSYPALKVTTSVVKTAESSPGAGDQVYYTGEELLEQLKANVDGILNGGDDLNLPELARRIQQVNAELNGGTYTDTESQSQTVLGFKNKEIKDVVRVAFTWDGTTATAADATLAADEHLDNGQTSLPAYSTNGQPIVGATGTAVTFNYNTKTFSAAPYVLDIDATKASGGIDSTTGQVIAGAAVYTAFTGGFKVFPTGTWTLETLPTTALLDNNEMQMIAYDQALQKIAVQIATDKQLIERVEEAIGEVAIQDAIKDATEVIDARLDKLEGTDDSNLNKVAVKVSQITGKPAGADAGADPAETVSKTTAIASKAYTDAVDNAIKADIGAADAAASYDGNGLVQAGTVRGEINSIKGKMLYKDQLVNSVKSSVTEMQGEPGEETAVQVTSDINTINETALVSKFAAVDSYATQTRNALNTFTDTTAPATYVAISKVDDNYTKLTPSGSVYTYTYSDSAHPEVVGKKIFEEKISQIEDSLGDTGDAAYLHAAIVPAAAVSADSTTGVTAKAVESTHVTNGVADADMPVLSKLATEYLVQNEAEIRAKAIDDLDDKTYDWSNIVGYDGSAKTATVAKTQFNAVTGATADATAVETLVTAGTAETVDENTAVYSDTETDARINAAKAEAMSKESADKTELLNRIAFATQQANDALTREIARLTAEAGDTILDPADGTADVVASVDGAITALDKKTADWSNIEVSAGLTQIVDANNNVIQAAVAAESAADANTKFTSKQYVDDAILGAKGKAAKELVDVQRSLDGRIDTLESVTNIVERITPVTSGDPAVTTITLSQTPIDAAQLEILVNGVSYFVADGAMTISGNVLTWDNTAAGFKLTDVLDTGETVVARYQYTDSTKLSPIA